MSTAGDAFIAQNTLGNLLHHAAVLRELAVFLEAFVAGDDDAFTADDALRGHQALALAATQATGIRDRRQAEERRRTVVHLDGRRGGPVQN